MSYPNAINFGSMAATVIQGLGEDVTVRFCDGQTVTTRAIISEELEPYPAGFETETRDSRMQADFIKADVTALTPEAHIIAGSNTYRVIIVDDSDADVLRAVIR